MELEAKGTLQRRIWKDLVIKKYQTIGQDLHVWRNKYIFFWLDSIQTVCSKNAAFFIDQKVNTVTIHSLLNNIRRSLLWANTTVSTFFKLLWAIWLMAYYYLLLQFIAYTKNRYSFLRQICSWVVFERMFSYSITKLYNIYVYGKRPN